MGLRFLSSLAAVQAIGSNASALGSNQAPSPQAYELAEAL